MPTAFDSKNRFRLVKICTYKPIIIYSNAIRACGHKVFPEDSDWIVKIHFNLVTLCKCSALTVIY
jgi:hypothetical protein